MDNQIAALLIPVDSFEDLKFETLTASELSDPVFGDYEPGTRFVRVQGRPDDIRVAFYFLDKALSQLEAE